MSLHDSAPRPTIAPIRILGYASLGITALALGLMAFDVLREEQRAAPWWLLVLGTVGLVATAFLRAASHPLLEKPIVQPPIGGRTRALVVATVAGLLVIQALVPLRYYLGQDRFDERFSWRMFSAVRVYSCDLSAFETRGGVERPTRLMSTIHAAWVTVMRRGRAAAIRRYLGWRCEHDDIEAARIVNRCTTPEGERVPDLVRIIDCRDGVVHDGASE